MTLVPRLIETIFNDPFEDLVAVLPYREPIIDFSRRSWGQMNRALRQLNQLSQHLNQEMAAVKNAKDGFEVNIDCKNFQPEEVNVKLVGNNLIVEGKHEERSDEHGFISRQFKRRYVVPDNIEMEKLQSQLSLDGILTIRAPKKATQAVEGDEKTIPISLTNQVHKAVEGCDKKKKCQQQEKMETK